MTSIPSILAVALLSVGSIFSLQAQLLTWDANGGGTFGGDGNWDNSTTNWWNGAANVAWSTGDTAVFDSVGGGQVVTVTETVSVGGILYQGGANTTLQGAGAITTANADNLRFNYVTFSRDDRTLTIDTRIAGTGTWSFTGDIDGTGQGGNLNYALTNNANDRDGDITVIGSNGPDGTGGYEVRLQFSDSSQLGPSTNQVIVDSDGRRGTLVATADLTLANTVVFSGGGIGSSGGSTLTVADNSLLTLDAGAQRQIGAGTVELTYGDDSSYSNGWTIGGGTLEFSNANQLGSGLIQLEGGTLHATATTTLDAEIQVKFGDNAINVAAGQTLTTSNIGANSNSRGFEKLGDGTLNITDANGYSQGGSFDVLAGTVLVNNTSGSGTGNANVTVAGGATFGGDGIVAPAVDGRTFTVEAGGTVAPGNSTGTLDFDLTSTTGTVVFETNALFEFELNSPSDLDQIAFLDDGGTNIAFNNNVINFDDLTGGSLAAAEYDLFTFDTAGYTGTVQIGTGLESYGGNVSLTHDTTRIYLTVVPEPSTLAMAGAGIALLLLRRRRS